MKIKKPNNQNSEVSSQTKESHVNDKGKEKETKSWTNKPRVRLHTEMKLYRSLVSFSLTQELENQAP